MYNRLVRDSFVGSFSLGDEGLRQGDLHLSVYVWTGEYVFPSCGYYLWGLVISELFYVHESVSYMYISFNTTEDINT